MVFQNSKEGVAGLGHVMAQGIATTISDQFELIWLRISPPGKAALWTLTYRSPAT